MTPSHHPQPRTGFTLVEVLVVVGVIVVLVAILIPSLESAIASSKRSRCASNLGQIGHAVTLYVNESKESAYPSKYNATTNPYYVKHYLLLGQIGKSVGYDNPTLHDVDQRSLNKYLGYSGVGATVGIAQCPSDIGGRAVLDPNGNFSFTDEGTANSSTNVFDSTGNSYVEAFGYFGATTHTARTGISFMFGTDPNQPAQARPASSKVLLGDAPIHGENKYFDPANPTVGASNRWHETDKAVRQFNILFADYHVEFFTFKKNSAGVPEIETLAVNAAGNPSRGFW